MSDNPDRCRPSSLLFFYDPVPPGDGSDQGRFPPFGAAVITHPNASARSLSFIEVTPLDLLCSWVEGSPSYGKSDPSPAGNWGYRRR